MLPRERVQSKIDATRIVYFSNGFTREMLRVNVTVSLLAFLLAESIKIIQRINMDQQHNRNNITNLQKYQKHISCVYFRLNVASRKYNRKSIKRGGGVNVYILGQSLYARNRECYVNSVWKYISYFFVPPFREVSLENLPDAAQGRFRSLARGLHGHPRRREGFASKDLSLYYDLRGFLQ